jgi:serine/threonine-protein kinase HipA
MTSEPSRVYVWVWLPARTDPVVAGVLQASDDVLDGSQVLLFRYAASYRARPDAVSLFTAELPLTDQVHDPRRVRGRVPLPLAGALRDAAPDAWGRRVINARLGADDVDLSEVTYLLGSGTNRIGALDFQESATRYVARDQDATLEQLLSLAEHIEAGEPIPASLTAAAQHGTSIGGARPKALLRDGDRDLVAKFSSTSDSRPVVQAEAVAMLLARHAGITVPDVSVVESAGKKVLLVDRFDRVTAEGGQQRRQMLSMLTIAGVSEMGSRHTSYAQLADIVRTGPWTGVKATLVELYTRLVFSILVGNNDDHLRNHAAFWDGRNLTLTPAYDLAPQPRSTSTSTQAIGITRDGQRASQVRLARAVAPDFQLSVRTADDIIDRVHAAIVDNWDDACDQAGLSRAERATLWGREFVNEYAFWDQA